MVDALASVIRQQLFALHAIGVFQLVDRQLARRRLTFSVERLRFDLKLHRVIGGQPIFRFQSGGQRSVANVDRLAGRSCLACAVGHVCIHGIDENWLAFSIDAAIGRSRKLDREIAFDGSCAFTIGDFLRVVLWRQVPATPVPPLRVLHIADDSPSDLSSVDRSPGVASGFDGDVYWLFQTRLLGGLFDIDKELWPLVFFHSETCMAAAVFVNLQAHLASAAIAWRGERSVTRAELIGAKRFRFDLLIIGVHQVEPVTERLATVL